MAWPGLWGAASQAGGDQGAQWFSLLMAHPAADQLAIEAMGQSLADPLGVQGAGVAQEGDIANLECRTAAFQQQALCCTAVEGQTLVFVDRFRQQHIHFPAAQGSKKGCGIAEIDQVEAGVARLLTPVALERFQALLRGFKADQSVRTSANKAVVEEAILVFRVGGGRNRRQVGGCEQALEGA